MLAQINMAKRTIINGNRVIPTWRIEAADGPWLIHTRLHHSHPGENERILHLVRRFMAWKHAEAFVLVGCTRLSFISENSLEEAVISMAGARDGLRVAYLERIHPEPRVSFGPRERCNVGHLESTYWTMLPTRPQAVSCDEASALAVIFGEYGEMPAHKLNEPSMRCEW
jgi:hypothetical protein